MRRIAAIFLIGSILALGAGLVRHAHNLQHVHDGLHHHSGAAGDPASDPHDHDDPLNCFLHALLQAPILSAGWVPLLVCLGLFIAFLTLLSDRPVAARLLERLDCRGPPVLALPFSL